MQTVENDRFTLWIDREAGMARIKLHQSCGFSCEWNPDNPDWIKPDIADEIGSAVALFLAKEVREELKKI